MSKEEILKKLNESDLYKAALMAARNEEEKKRLQSAAEGLINSVWSAVGSVEELKKDPEKLKQIQDYLMSLNSK